MADIIVRDSNIVPLFCELSFCSKSTRVEEVLVSCICRPYILCLLILISLLKSVCRICIFTSGILYLQTILALPIDLYYVASVNEFYPCLQKVKMTAILEAISKIAYDANGSIGNLAEHQN